MRSKFVLAAAGLALSLAAVASSPALAAPGGGKSGGSTTASISLDQADPHLGDKVTFTTSGGARITVACYQGSVIDLVWSTNQPVGTTFLLGGTSSIWLSRGGPADCYAYLFAKSQKSSVLAVTVFTAGGLR